MAHRYWRILIHHSESLTGGVSAAEIELRASQGGADQTGSGTPSASSEYSGTYAASKAFDNDSSTFWSSASNDYEEWIKYDFGSGNDVNIEEIIITNRNDSYYKESPSCFDLQYSDDDSIWTTYMRWRDVGWTQGQTQSFNSTNDFIIDGTAGSHRYWRIRTTLVFAEAPGTNAAEIELRMSQGGADQTGSGTPSASTEYSGSYDAAKAFDNNDNTFWSSTGVRAPHWIKYDFGVGITKNIVQVSYKIRADGYVNQAPKELALQYSDDDSSWYTLLIVFDEPVWGIGETRTFPASEGIISMAYHHLKQAGGA